MSTNDSMEWLLLFPVPWLSSYQVGFSGDVASLTWQNLAFQPYFSYVAPPMTGLECIKTEGWGE